MTAEIPDPPPTPDLRVSDAEREEVAQLLRQALAEGRLTFTEYDERVGAAYAARTRADFTPLTIDLPSQPNLFAAVAQPSPPADPTAAVAAAVSPVGLDGALDPPRREPAGVDWTVAVMSGNERTGRWRPSRHTRAVAVMGGCELDLREIAFPTDTLLITAVAVMGGIEIIVPEGVEVEVTGVSVMGGRSVKVADTPRRPGTPVVRIRAIAVMGGVEVRSKPQRPTTTPGHVTPGHAATGHAAPGHTAIGHPGTGHKGLDPGPGAGQPDADADADRERPGEGG
ncbi:DUF1707 domain-containing protein [Frankia sp. ACN1ag]|uniref:DUF1707 SHOCT-like domain-containing protein n=1 Tax=Frankia sp. ACN1ag TaxID=102891 RepID=UPI0006DBE6CE|nr:DUF1707 domain-containing protein [Frankia sp. ACN1ag]KQC36754.1 hypothetical protein UK82_19395 [Frankia sp. ACN1ag]